MLHVGIITVSDRATAGVYEDRGGPAVRAFCEANLAEQEGGWESHARIVPDEPPLIRAAVLELLEAGCRLIIATGGTGPTHRDVTPEAIRPLLDKELPGFAEKMRADAWDDVPTAILARQACGVRGDALLLSLPGSPKAIPQCLGAVWGAIPHCLKLIADNPAE
ncbi:molybdopterin adenylyltransferase [Alienimonas chondri]|uniref:Molybdopterin adenylyltransferase n=1 Tax=Alienimonas chondri TaxID=2681879 RepID=A0ABX1VGV0_9PLAN|nr:molybdopterin adenylyltransferase [Alienimonas chondri]NNJ27357.1 Molybdopterin adenylyltransferase [Alienimonas chondri]